MLGKKAIDEDWLSALELRDELETLARDLHTRFRDDESWWEKYPGW